MDDKIKSTTIQIPGGWLEVAPTPKWFPLGARGARLCTFHMKDSKVVAEVAALRMPGVITYTHAITCAWDAALPVSDILGCSEQVDKEYKRRNRWFYSPAGIEEYKSLGLHNKTRDYQKAAIEYMCWRAWAIEGDYPRAGKTLTVLGAAILLGVKKVLVVVPAVAKYEWASQIARWTNYEAAMLYGKAGEEVRVFCRTCDGTRRIEDGGRTRACTACRARNGQSLGEKIYTATELQPIMAARKWKEPHPTLKKKDGTPRTVTRSERYIVQPAQYKCSVHPEVVSDSPGICGECKKSVYDAIDRSRFVIVNYDILTAHRTVDGRGKEYIRADLPGWAKVLTRWHFDLALADEAHALRGWASSYEDRINSRRQRFVELVDKVPRVWLVTATPSYSFTRDLWALLDAASGGLWS